MRWGLRSPRHGSRSVRRRLRSSRGESRSMRRGSRSPRGGSRSLSLGARAPAPEFSLIQNQLQASHRGRAIPSPPRACPSTGNAFPSPRHAIPLPRIAFLETAREIHASPRRRHAFALPFLALRITRRASPRAFLALARAFHAPRHAAHVTRIELPSPHSLIPKGNLLERAELRQQCRAHQRNRAAATRMLRPRPHRRSSIIHAPRAKVLTREGTLNEYSIPAPGNHQPCKGDSL